MSQQAYILFYANQDTTATTTPAKEQVKEPTPSISKQENVQSNGTAEKRKTRDEDDESPKKKLKDEFVEGQDVVVADRPQDWFVRSSALPYRSLRGSYSPDTYGAALSHPSAWVVRPIDQPLSDEDRKFLVTPTPRKWRKKPSTWHIV